MTTPNIVFVVEAEPKSGKTHWACTCPEPIFLLSLDLGAKPIVEKFPDKKIVVKEMPMPLFDSLSATDLGFDKFWREVKQAVYEAVDSGEYKTIVIDTGTALWEIIRYGYNEEEGKAVGASSKARSYGEPNARMYGIITKCQLAGVNLVLLHYITDVYENDQATGKKKLDGWRRTEGLADVVLVNRKERIKGKTGSTFVTTIKDCRFDHTLDGTDIDMATYDDIITLLGF